MSEHLIPRHSKKQHAQDGQFDVFPSYKGGHTTIYGGYVWEYVGHHRLANKWGFAAQHRLVGEDIYGGPLPKGYVVHHCDENRTNNHPTNLEVMTQREHRSHHAKQTALRSKIPLDADKTKRLLSELGGIKPTARALGISHSTLRNRFPELCAPYQRTSPTKIDCPRDIERILLFASDPSVGLREAAQTLNMSARTIRRICDARSVPWVKQIRCDAGKKKPIRKG